MSQKNGVPCAPNVFDAPLGLELKVHEFKNLYYMHEFELAVCNKCNMVLSQLHVKRWKLKASLMTKLYHTDDTGINSALPCFINMSIRLPAWSKIQEY